MLLVLRVSEIEASPPVLCIRAREEEVPDVERDLSRLGFASPVACVGLDGTLNAEGGASRGTRRWAVIA